MTVKEFKDYILKHMTAEEALERLLATEVAHYEKLKLEKGENPDTLSPMYMLAMAAMDCGWDIAVEKREDGMLRGLSVGTPDYLKDMLKQKEDDNEPIS